MLSASRWESKLVELHFAEYRAQGCLGELRGLVDVVRDLDYGAGGVEDAQRDDGVDLDGDVVAGDDVLRRNLEHFLPQGDANHLIEWAEDEDDAGAFGLRQDPAEAEDDAALIFAENLDRTQKYSTTMTMMMRVNMLMAGRFLAQAVYRGAGRTGDCAVLAARADAPAARVVRFAPLVAHDWSCGSGDRP